MNLTEFFNSLPHIDKPYNKYASYSLAFNNPYRLCTSYDAFRYDKFDPFLKKWLAEQGKVITMPNMLNGEVIGLYFRSITSKVFRRHEEASYIPYGAGFNSKTNFNSPWLIVESVLDSDFLRNFYPYVIATNGVAVSNNIMSFIKGTSSLCYCAFDMDTAGNDGFHKICMKHSGSSKEFFIKRLTTPMNFDGLYLKDFGEILDCLHDKKLDEYDYYVSSVKSSLLFIES